LTLDFYLTRYTAARETEQAQRRLTSEGLVLAPEVSDVPPSQLEDWARRAATRARARITVVDPSGVVLADSEHDPETMENHAGRFGSLSQPDGGRDARFGREAQAGISAPRSYSFKYGGRRSGSGS